MLNEVQDMEIQPFHELAKNELICELRKTPTVLYGIFVELMQQFWSGDPKDRLFGTPEVSWDRDPHKTKIWIDTELRWEATHPEFRPAIYVKLGPIQFNTINGSTTGLVRRDIQEAEYHYARTGEGQVSLVHVGATAGEACALADATMDYLDAFAPVITEDFCFDWFRPVSHEPLSQLPKDSNEKYGSVVSYAYRFTNAWNLKLESPKLRRLVVRSVDAVSRRLEVGDYWNFKPYDGGLGLPKEVAAEVTKVP